MRDRRRSLDPLWLACGLAALAIYALRGFDGPLSRDLGVYTYTGQRLVDGVLPYVGLFERGGPLAQFVPGLAVFMARAAGIDDILAIRMVYLAFAVAAVALLYLLARDVVGSRTAGMVAAGVMLSYPGFSYFAANGPRDKTITVAMLVAALLALARARWMLVGVLVSLATLSWQPALLAGIAAVVTTVVLDVPRGGRLRLLSRVAVGGLIPVAVLLLVYAVAGRLSTLIETTVTVNLRYTVHRPFGGEFWRNVDRLVGWYGQSLWFLGLGSIAIVARAVREALRTASRRRRGALISGLGSSTVVMILWTVWDFDNFPDVYALLPLGALGVAVMVADIRPSWLSRSASGAIIAFGLVLALAYALGTPASGLGRQRAAVEAVLEAIPGDRTILSIEAPQPLVLSQSVNPTRFQLFGSGAVEYVDDTWPGGIEGYAEWIGDAGPTLVAVGRGSVPEWLAPALARSYWRAGTAPGWAWYLRTDAGEEELRAVRTAIVLARRADVAG